jgi:prevent-host-death family protein
MSCYSVAEAKNNFSKVLAAAERGERVSITRRGKIVADLVPREPPKAFRIDVEELKRRRIVPRNGPINTVEALEEIRNERPW